jgi:hypothetical protein
MLTTPKLVAESDRVVFGDSVSWPHAGTVAKEDMKRVMKVQWVREGDKRMDIPLLFN